jgi:3-methyladenine DNA glycosylase AlkD
LSAEDAMKKAEDLVDEVRAYCRAHADPKGAQKFARYFKEGYDAWGLLDKENPLWNEKQAEWLEKYEGMGLGGFLEAGALLFASGKFEEGSLAIRFAAALRDRFDAEEFERLSSWFSAGIRNWAHVDVLCGEVIGPLLTSGKIQRKALGSWRTSPHRFQRRAVPVALIPFLKKEGKGEVAPLLTFIRPLMADGERVVHQGLGWFLREAWKLEPETVENLLLEWKDRAARLIFQYATEKMTAAAKARFKTSKQKKASRPKPKPEPKPEPKSKPKSKPKPRPRRKL